MNHPPKVTIPHVNMLVNDFYRLPANSTGGVLHCVLDDGNMQESMLRACLEECEQQHAFAATILRFLLQMTPSQRRRMVSLNYGNARRGKFDGFQMASTFTPVGGGRYVRTDTPHPPV